MAKARAPTWRGGTCYWTLSSTAYGRQLGTFAGTVSATVGPDPMASSFKRDDKRMTRIREGGPRPENYGLTSGDYGEPRYAERPSQPHQENDAAVQQDNFTSDTF